MEMELDILQLSKTFKEQCVIWDGMKTWLSRNRCEAIIAIMYDEEAAKYSLKGLPIVLRTFVIGSYEKQMKFNRLQDAQACAWNLMVELENIRKYGGIRDFIKEFIIR